MKACMARQPIYTAEKAIYGYELLYRDEQTKNFANFVDGDVATKNVLSDAIMAFGLERLTNGKLAFINFGRNLIMDDLIEMLDKENFVIEILEDTVVDNEFVEHIKAKSEKGYIFAIDDYIGNPLFEPLIPYVSIVKVDFAQINGRALRKLCEKLRADGKILLAEKVETQEQCDVAYKLGFELLQGYFFEKPLMLSMKIADVQGSTCARMFSELSASALSFSNLSEIIRTDVNLTLRLMKHTNSLQFYRGNEINSVHLALVSMGIEEVKRWTTLMFLREITGNGNEEITKNALVRALLSEWLAKKMGLNTEIAFLTGMFSMIDVIENDNLHNIFKSLSVASEIKEALFNIKGQYTDILDFVRAYEKGEWANVLQFATKHQLQIDELSRVYMNSVNYSDRLFD